MKCKLLMVLVAVLFITGVAFADADPGVRDTLTIDNIISANGEQGVVEINFFSDEELGGLTIPLHWDNANMTCDSVSFVGSRVDYLATKLREINNTNQTVNVGAVVFLESPIPAGTGLAAKVYFSVNAADFVATIDTVTIGPASFLFTLPSGAGMDTPVMNAGTLTDADYDSPNLPKKFSLSQNFPNPFNPSTKIAYTVERKENVNISVFNILGQKVNTLVNNEQPAGEYQVIWYGDDNDGDQVASGIYFYKMTSDSFEETHKMVLMR